MIYKKIIKYIFVLSILIIIFVISNFYKSDNDFFEDIITFGLWKSNNSQNEYNINKNTITEIDVFTTIYRNKYKKIAPGSKGSFVITLKRPKGEIYDIEIKEKTSKPKNLFFIIDNKKYSSIEDMENIIEEKFSNSEKIIINWEWDYCISDTHDIQDTIDGEKGGSYIFEIETIIEDLERMKI